MHPTFEISEPREIALPDRASTLVWDSGPGDGGLPLLLLHGWNVDAPTNYGYAFPHLRTQQRVVMFDMQGHGNGPRRQEPFTMEAAAADGVAVLDALDIDKAVVCGFSLGGAVAQTMLRNHPDRCAGLVLSATAGTFAETRRESGQFRALRTAASALRRSPDAITNRAFTVLRGYCTRRYPGWIGDVVASADPINLLEAGASLGSFNSESWVDTVDVPSAFVVTARDSVVPVHRQVELAERLSVHVMHNVAADHDVPIRNNDEFHAALCAAAAAVTTAAVGPSQVG